MPPTSFADDADALRSLLAEAGPASRLYLTPLALVPGTAAVQMRAQGEACAIAGGPLAAAAMELCIRDGSSVRRELVGTVRCSSPSVATTGWEPVVAGYPARPTGAWRARCPPRSKVRTNTVQEDNAEWPR